MKTNKENNVTLLLMTILTVCIYCKHNYNETNKIIELTTRARSKIRSFEHLVVLPSLYINKCCVNNNYCNLSVPKQAWTADNPTINRY